MGGAIFARDFKKLEIINCKFSDNLAYGSVGENIYADTFSEVVRIKDSSFDSYLTSIYLNQGNDIDIDNVQLTNRSDIQSMLKDEQLNWTIRLIGKIRYQNKTTWNISDYQILKDNFNFIEYLIVDDYFQNKGSNNNIPANNQNYSDDFLYP